MHKKGPGLSTAPGSGGLAGCCGERAALLTSDNSKSGKFSRGKGEHIIPPLPEQTSFDRQDKCIIYLIVTAPKRSRLLKITTVLLRRSADGFVVLRGIRLSTDTVDADR
jgi:hypothetical protein